MAGSSVEWMRDSLQMVSSAPELVELAGQVPDNGGMYFVPAFSGLLAPHWRDDARGVFVGLTHFCSREHFCRAVLESTAFQTLEVFDAMASDSGVKLSEIRADGGLSKASLLMQFQADLLGIPVGRLEPVVAPAVLADTPTRVIYHSFRHRPTRTFRRSIRCHAAARRPALQC